MAEKFWNRLFNPTIEEGSYLDIEEDDHAPASPRGKISLFDRAKRLRKILGGAPKDKLVEEVDDLASMAGKTFTTGATLPEKLAQLEAYLLGETRKDASGGEHALVEDVNRMIDELGITVLPADSLEKKVSSLEKHILSDPDAAASESLVQRVKTLYKEIFGSP